MKILGSALVWVFCALIALIALVAMPLSAAFGSGRRALRIATALDQVGAVLAGGDEDETWSARCWRLNARPYYSNWVRRIDRWFFAFTGKEDHCLEAFLSERARRQRPYDTER